MELTSAHLRPYIELIPGAEPARADEQYAAGALSLRSASNGHSNGSAGSHQALPLGNRPRRAAVHLHRARSSPTTSGPRRPSPRSTGTEPEAGAAGP